MRGIRFSSLLEVRIWETMKAGFAVDNSRRNIVQNLFRSRLKDQKEKEGNRPLFCVNHR